MNDYVGLDVSLAQTAICVVDDDGKPLWRLEPGPVVLAERFVAADALAGEQALMRLTCRTRSRSKMARSRDVRRRSSSSGEGGTTMAQTRGSPRRQASSVLSSVSPSMASVFARRCRRGTVLIGME